MASLGNNCLLTFADDTKWFRPVTNYTDEQLLQHDIVLVVHQLVWFVLAVLLIKHQGFPGTCVIENWNLMILIRKSILIWKFVNTFVT